MKVINNEEKRESSIYYRIYEIIWELNILNLDEYDNLDEYKYITYDLIKFLENVNYNDFTFDEFENDLFIKINEIIRYWLGHKIIIESMELKKLANKINTKVNKNKFSKQIVN